VNQPTRTIDGLRLAVDSITDLNAWYETHRCGSTLAVGGRYETRDGRLFGLGGLSWNLHIKAIEGGPLDVTVETAEGEVLPDLPVVRDGFPYALARQAVSA